MVEPLFLDIAERHHLDQRHIMALRVAPGDEIGEFLLVHALQSHGVQFYLEPCCLGRRDPIEHLAKTIAPGQRGKALPVERIERDIHPLHARTRQPFCVAGELRAIGRERQFLQIMAQPPPKRGEQVHDVAPHQRLAPGDPQLGHSARDKAGGELIKLLQRQHLCLGQELHRLGHAIGAAQVAAIRDRKPQVGDAPLEGVHQRRAAITAGAHHNQIAAALRGRKGAGLVIHAPHNSGL